MKSIAESSFDDILAAGPDILQTFEHVWREIDARDDSQAGFDADRDSVWLECNAELVDVGSVDIIGIRRSELGVEMLQFICRYCNERHESLRFR
jgi:hypothetical protein